MDSSRNEWLIVKSTVLLNEIIEPVIVGLDKYFGSYKLKAYVTSGERTSEMQLDVIRQYCQRYGVDKEYPEVMTCSVLSRKWETAWSKLLNIGVVINPPLPAKCLFDYYRNGVNKKGQEIGHSPHYWGRAFDIGGGVDHDITNELNVVLKAIDNKLPGLKGYLPERKNNCLHIDCIPVPQKNLGFIG